MNELEMYKEKTFDNIRHIDENGNEYWEARELMIVLEYSEWRNFVKVINKAKIACLNASGIVNNDFVDNNKIVLSGATTKKIEDYQLSRYACYLIAQNGDSRKPVIALAQTYFAVQTRKMELTEKEFSKLSEDEKRLYRRKQTKDGNRVIYGIAKEKGVQNFDKFTNAGYKGLHGGKTADDNAKRKGLRYHEEILDNMCSAELDAKVFRITQIEGLLEKQESSSEEKATDTHYVVGKAIRDTIKKLGGTMPEDLPTPEKSLKELEKENNNLIKNT